MTSLSRGVAAAFSAIAAFYLVGKFGGILAMMVGLPGILPFIGSLAAAWWTWRHVWTGMPSGLAQAAFTGGIVVGAAGFIGGFFGPMLVTPGANQGPLLGIFITGPLGFVLGGIGGAARWLARSRDRRSG